MNASISVRPFWKIGPAQTAEKALLGEKHIAFGPGPGWGDGLHETTQMCLQAIAFFAPQGRARWSMLDFGSGSGLLSLAGARLGARVTAVEIDEAGILHAEDNARLNGLSDRIQHSRELPSDGAWVEHRHDLIVANILRPILMEYAQGLSLRLAPHGTLILSGLVATDVPDVGVRFSGFLDGYRLEVFQRGDWRALVWRKGVAP